MDPCDVKGCRKGVGEIVYSANGLEANLCWKHWGEACSVTPPDTTAEWIKRRCIKRRKKSHEG